MWERGALIPNWTVTDQEGAVYRLWDFRQRVHLVLIVDPSASSQTRQGWVEAFAREREKWDWLQTRVLVLSSTPPDLPPGVHLISRYGHYMTTLPLNAWSSADIEKEFIYYEARHC